MKLDSKYFDSIRVSRTGRTEKVAETASAPASNAQRCQWADCTKRGAHRAPKGRNSEGQYYFFCRDHVTLYNKSYNYFAGMGDSEVADYQKSATTGHRPTWSMGANGAGPEGNGAHAAEEARDPLEVLREIRGRIRGTERAYPEPRRRSVPRIALKHLQSLNLDEHATKQEIRNQFKALVKLHHPDHNGGDRSSEERFREVINAYNYLKQSGLC